MNRRSFFVASGQTMVTAAILQPVLASAAEQKSTSSVDLPFSFAAAPVLLNPAASGIGIVCVLNSPGTGWVEYGETESLGQRMPGGAHGFLPYEEKVLCFRLEKLRPGTKYFYRVHAAPVVFKDGNTAHRGPAIATELRSFRTLDPAAEKASFTIWNDTHENKETLRQLTAAHRAAPGDFLLWNGDVTNNVISDEVLYREYFSPAGEAYADSVPLFFSRGNHDVRGVAARKLSEYTAGAGGEHFYTFRQGPVACVVLDTGEDKPDTVASYAGLNDFAAYRTQQREWLARAIEQPEFKSAPFRIAIMHIPLHWDAEVPENWWKVWGGHKGWICEDGLQKWGDLLEKAGICCIISGHTHRHAWFPPANGRSYGQLIGGGPKPEAATITRVEADARELRITVGDLAGKPLIEQKFSV